MADLTPRLLAEAACRATSHACHECAKGGEGVYAFLAPVVAALIAEAVAAERARALSEASVLLTRDHTMPPNKDHHGYGYRNGWWDAINKARSVLNRIARETPGGAS